MLDKKQKKHFQDLLLNMRAEVAGAIAEDASQTVELDQSRQGRLSRMDALQGQQLALETQRRQQRRLKAIDGALTRLENDEFGFCFQCDESIALPRLQFDPTVTRCIQCAE
ncbi:MAG: TraR/DksA C4-type zinc finger protein [Methylophaga sp.]